MRNLAPARSPATEDRRLWADRPSIAGRARIRSGGRPSDRRRRGKGGQAFQEPVSSLPGWTRQSINKRRLFKRWMRGSSPSMTTKHHTAKHRKQTAYIEGMRPQDILIPAPAGLCCKPGGFHIDPARPVERAVITHGHSDHARSGHGAVLATAETLDLMRLRYGEGFSGTTQAIRYGERIELGGIAVTMHPAGHVLGSAQVAVETNGLRIVASGDYKNVADPTCPPFELVPCDVFITEATFGLPVFRHGDPDGEIAKLLRSVALFPERAHLIGAYSLGKAQRVIALIRKAGYDAPIYLHGALETLTRYYERRGIALGNLRAVRDATR